MRICTTSPVPVSLWTQNPGIGLYASGFLRLRDDGLANEVEDGTCLFLPWNTVADLAVEDLAYMKFPNVCPYTLELNTNQSITDADFRIHVGFVHKGRRILGWKRDGAWFRVGNDYYVLTNPLYEIIEQVEGFTSAHVLGIEDKMLQWGRISEKLPDTAIVPDRLNSISVTVATGFTLHPFLNEAGEPDFDPVIGTWENVGEKEGEQERKLVATLPSARQSVFGKKFRGLHAVKYRYAVGGANYVVFSREVEKSLGAVHQAQQSSPKKRLEFLNNVSGYLRGTLDEAGETGIEVDAVFSDEGLSDRVKGIGAWEEIVVPWVKRASEPWMPPEMVGLFVGDKPVEVPLEELTDLLDHVETAIREGTPTVVTSSGEEIPANEGTVNAIKTILDRVKRDRGVDEVGEEEEEVEQKKQVLLVIDNLDDLKYRQERRAPVPGVTKRTPALKSTLLAHQQEALEWLFRHWEAGNWGALLADDMGLGKTLEALAFLSSLQQHVQNQGLPHQPILVVAPTGLLRNWLDEHRKHMAGNGLGMAVEAYGKGLRALKPADTSPGNEIDVDIVLPKLCIKKLSSASWVLTTYETLRDYQHSFGRIHWSVAIFDEAQKIKNPASQLSVAALAMKIDFALLMTGTPVENRPADLWALLERVEPGMFGPLNEFSRSHETEGAEKALKRLHNSLTKTNGAPSLMLRRLKEDHLKGLPNKSDHYLRVEMPPVQAKAYAHAVDQSRGAGLGKMLEAILRIRAISLHPEPLDDHLTDQEYIQKSARLLKLFEILEEIAHAQEKALVFLESLQMQSFLIGAFRRRFDLSEDVLVINGTVTGSVRKSRVDIFQKRKGFDVMLLSPRAGGVGLTLTAANHVIHLSRWWNPAVEDQCTDRVFRIGQTRDIHVYFPIAEHPVFKEDSFDWKLNQLITRKRQTNRSILSPVNMSQEDKKNLYRDVIDVVK